MNARLKQPAFLVSALLALGLLFLAYAEHFHNPFQFDDAHTIENNQWIRSIDSIPRFFTDATTVSSLPSNQAYRPLLTTLNAFDTWLGGEGVPIPFYFHLDIFVSYVLLGVLLFFFFLKLLDKARPGHWLNHWLALFGTALFWVHTANAETINYVISRSDSQSTLFVVLAFVLYMSKRARPFFFIPVIAGFFLKETALMIAPLILVYEWLFGKLDTRGWLRVGFTFLLSGALYLLSVKMRPDTWVPGGDDPFQYLITQPFVIVHYFSNFILPIHLSADTDWQLVESVADWRVIAGVIFIAAMLWIAWVCRRREDMKPVSFGVLWFFIALAPTSSIIPFSEVLNDHRVFFPYIGLVLAFISGASFIIDRIIDREALESPTIFPKKISVAIVALLMLSAHTWGTRQRTEVWSSPYTLWRDCAIKSPMNARGLMNYGNALVVKGREALQAKNQRAADSLFYEADSVYMRAQKIWPYYAYLNINIGVLREWQSRIPEAEAQFKAAIENNNTNPECYYFYADFLVRRNRASEAPPYVEKGLQLSPAHDGLNRLKNFFGQGLVTFNALHQAEILAEKEPTPENFLNLSLEYYNSKRYEDCIKAAEKALELRPGYVEAHNNVCIAYTMLGNWDKAIEAGKKCLQLKPDYELAKNNLVFAQNNKNYYEPLEAALRKSPSADGWLNLSLSYYNSGIYLKCVEAATEAAKIQPGYAEAWNNICTAWNELGNWEKAIPAGEKAVQLKPDSELFRNNLKVAQDLKARSGGK